MKIGPGMYVENGRLELDIPEMLAAMGIPDTEENRDRCVEVAEKALQESGLLSRTATAKHTHAHRCPRCGRKWGHDGKRVKCPLAKKAICGRCNS